MALQEDGWPLGLRPVNARIGMVRNRDQFNGSISFTTLLTASPTCTTDSSSDLDTQSTGSFFHDKSITLGSLIGVSSILELSRRSTRRRTSEETLKDEKNCRSRFWLFSLCSKLSTDAVKTEERAPSLGQFLQAERRAINRNSPNFVYGPNDFSPVVPLSSHVNPLFVGDEIVPQARDDGGGGRRNNGYGAPLLFS
ncbi:uncharacterized protein [Euphorbia lathyris]|uniref:uncharacterized protein n=1 Tax=Euphorbia lathyris TaxID=212925 RepID=UPI003313966A